MLRMKIDKNSMRAIYPLLILLSFIVVIVIDGNGFFPVPKAYGSVVYVVQPGDSLYTIGLKFGVSWQTVASVNNINSPYIIYPNEVLIISATRGVSPPPLRPTTPSSSPTQPGKVATGNTMYDQFDLYILGSVQKYRFTDPMIIKSMVMQESAFQPNAVSSDIPCGMPRGWTAYESRSFGLMQVTPACIEPATRPNIIQDPNSPAWGTSWFNPQYNIDRGVKALSGALSSMKNKFSGCTANQYMMMAVGAYNSGDGSIFGCGSWNDRAGTYIAAVLGHHRTFSQMANIRYPY